VRYYHATTDCVFWNYETLEAPFLRGDAFEDGDVDLVDAVRILFVLFAGVEEPEDAGALDANSDESFDVSDAVHLLDYLFRGGPAPPPPFWGPEAGAGSGSEVTVLYDNFPPLSGLRGAEWGFACLLRVGEEQVLLDTGADGTDLLFNMEALGVDVAQTDQLVLSHIHADHLGGLADVLEATGPIPVHIPETFPDSVRDQIRLHGSDPLDVAGRQEICPGLWSSGTLAGTPDEQILHLPTGKGLVVVTACAHPGIVELVDQALQRFGRVYMVLGGFHLHKSTDRQVLDVIDALKSREVQKVAPCHCTGERASELLQEEFGEGYVPIGAGARFSWRP
jgi:7,8-dihydropterin-6-yl-methyl-4-(beta-D-ribofuranosyl)aminobenzene 5'-phosphate synthase